MAMSTCAGCGVALDSSGGHASRECPNCKRGESVEGRHFYCSKECFTSSWAVHKKRHVRKARTITLDMDVNYTRDEVASFGFMSDVEWDDFQATPDFTAAMAQQLKQAQMMSKEAEKCMMSKDAEKYNDIPRSSWNTSLNVICSMQKVTLEQVYSAVQDVLLMTTFLYDKESTDQHHVRDPQAKLSLPCLPPGIRSIESHTRRGGPKSPRGILPAGDGPSGDALC